VQAYDAQLADVAGLAVTDGNFIVGHGTNFVAESGATARTSLGLGTGDSPEFTAVNIGNASDTTITRSSAGVIAVEDSAVTGNFYAKNAIVGNANITNVTVTNLRLINKPYQVFSFSLSIEWLIQHNRDTDKMQISLFSSDGEQFFAKTKILDLNSVKISLTEATSGVAVVYFMTDNVPYTVPVMPPFITEDGDPIITETGANIIVG
jgi:hypothetical protein